MVELLKDSRALQALLQKLRDLPSPVSANPRPKTHQWVECPQRRLEVLGYSFLRFQNNSRTFLRFEVAGSKVPKENFEKVIFSFLNRFVPPMVFD